MKMKKKKVLCKVHLCQIKTPCKISHFRAKSRLSISLCMLTSLAHNWCSWVTFLQLTVLTFVMSLDRCGEIPWRRFLAVRAEKWCVCICEYFKEQHKPGVWKSFCTLFKYSGRNVVSRRWYLMCLWSLTLQIPDPLLCTQSCWWPRDGVDGSSFLCPGCLSPHLLFWFPRTHGSILKNASVSKTQWKCFSTRHWPTLCLLQSLPLVSRKRKVQLRSHNRPANPQFAEW